VATGGTRSIAGIFARYRSLHELLFLDTVRAVRERESGVMEESDFRAFISWRDGLTLLDMDSSSFNCYYVDALVQEFEDAKFVFVIRDCFSWLDSMLNMCIFICPMMVESMVEYVRRFLGPAFEPDLTHRTADLHRALPEMMEAGLRYWGQTNGFVLQNLPPARSLVLRIGELSQNLPALADLVGVSPETLVPRLSRLNERGTQYRLLQAIDAVALEQLAEVHCSALMREFFPDITLESFLRLDRSRGVFNRAGARPEDPRPAS
jgi:hypothetical protein